jgi:uncharacterized low-complexity protein
MSTSTLKPVALAVCTAVGGLSLATPAFAMQELASGYMASANAAGHDDKGAQHAHHGKDGEGACGMDKVDRDGDGRMSRAEFDAVHPDSGDMFATMDTSGDGFVDAAEHDVHHAAQGKAAEGKCGEGKCGEGACGGGA